MGRWGTGNFEDDGAADYRDEWVERLAATVTEILDDEDRAALDEEGEAVLVPTVEIIAILCEQCGAYPPEESVVSEWRDRYLQIYDDQIEGLEPRGKFGAERRAVIEQTFERLLNDIRAYMTESE